MYYLVESAGGTGRETMSLSLVTIFSRESINHPWDAMDVTDICGNSVGKLRSIILQKSVFPVQLIVTKMCTFVFPEPHFPHRFTELQHLQSRINFILFPHTLTRPPSAQVMSVVIFRMFSSYYRQKQQLHLKDYVLQVTCPCSDTKVF